MAESQVPYPYTANQLKALRAAMSEPRFDTYLKKGGGKEEYALALYLYNARVAKAFLYPLGVIEVTLRNAIDNLLVQKYGHSWHLSDNFRKQILMPDGLVTLDTAIKRAGANAPRSQIVAALTFDFWSNVFRKEYAPLWRTSLNIVFPNLPSGITRHEIQLLVKSINKFRNRIAHHEPVLDMNVTDIHSKIVQLVEYRCAETALWMKYHSTLATVIRTRPKLDEAVMPLKSRLDKNFVTVKSDTTLLQLLERTDRQTAIICTNDAGAPIAVFSMPEIAEYLAQSARKLGGMIDLTEQRVMTMIEGSEIEKTWVQMEETAALALAIRELQKPRIHTIVGVDVLTGKATGAILRAHRRY
jgi:hypothetical protein